MSDTGNTPTEEDLKICVDCRFSQLENKNWLCSHPSAFVQPSRSRVTGILPPSHQLPCRRARVTELPGHERRCGAKGRFWEAR